ncbi:hypothetical protein GGR35_003301 [Mucilaginibacter phyllosphaerae]|uniref:Uncharacterized protein n=1 Tax=Mucilaginibacter phyllosphaerae TaxID=1812349 RepID=A0ABR6IC87_9SPHI|nr:hypothetical protein [Mucilaginibacter phyllosphaerae]
MVSQAGSLLCFGYKLETYTSAEFKLYALLTPPCTLPEEELHIDNLTSPA